MARWTRRARWTTHSLRADFAWRTGKARLADGTGRSSNSDCTIRANCTDLAPETLRALRSNIADVARWAWQAERTDRANRTGWTRRASHADGTHWALSTWSPNSCWPWRSWVTS